MSETCRRHTMIEIQNNFIHLCSFVGFVTISICRNGFVLSAFVSIGCCDLVCTTVMLLEMLQRIKNYTSLHTHFIYGFETNKIWLLQWNISNDIWFAYFHTQTHVEGTQHFEKGWFFLTSECRMWATTVWTTFWVH